MGCGRIVDRRRAFESAERLELAAHLCRSGAVLRGVPGAGALAEELVRVLLEAVADGGACGRCVEGDDVVGVRDGRVRIY